VDQPQDAFTEESMPLCESCYEIELEDEYAGGAIGNDADQLAMNELEEAQQQQQEQIMQQEENDDNSDEDEKNDKHDKPRKVVALSGVARIVNEMGELFDDIDDDAFNIGPPDIGLLEPLVEAVHDRGYHDGFGLEKRSPSSSSSPSLVYRGSTDACLDMACSTLDTGFNRGSQFTPYECQNCSLEYQRDSHGRPIIIALVGTMEALANSMWMERTR